MTLPIERARTRRPVTWLTVLGVLLLPAVLGGILVAALYNPAERLDAITAAIVNDDQPVTIDGQLTPLGRQLTAGLVEGSGDADSNLTWVVSNEDDAAEGLADGTYRAVVTIPENFSAAATSAGQSLADPDAAPAPERATIEVTTPPDALVVDDAITSQITQVATSLLGEQLSALTLENVFLGFSTLGDQLGDAAAGATQLATGARDAADGAAQIPDGATQLATGAGTLSSGAGDLATGLDQITDGIGASATGANQLADGLDQAAASVDNQELVGAAQLSADNAAAAAGQTAGLAQSVGGLAQTLGGLAQSLGGLAAECVGAGGSEDFCTRLGATAGSVGIAAASAGTTAGDAVTAATSAGTASGYAGPTASGIAQLTSGTSAGLAEAASQTRVLAGGLGQLATGAGQSADGARQLSSGASQLGTGASELATGAGELASGLSTLADGTSTLASGLDEASAALPSYSDDQARTLAEVVSDPVTADGAGSQLFGASAIPLVSVLVLWFGGLGTFVALGAATRRALAARQPSAVLALRSFAPGAVIGAGQGVLVAVIVQSAASYDLTDWLAFTGLCVLAGVAFAAVNQALVAVLGGAGRWVAALVGVLAVATGVVSTVPGVLSSAASLMPTAPAYTAMVGVLTESGGVGAGAVGLVFWTLVALGATTLAVSRRRTTSARALLAAPATA